MKCMVLRRSVVLGLLIGMVFVPMGMVQGSVQPSTGTDSKPAGSQPMAPSTNIDSGDSQKSDSPEPSPEQIKETLKSVRIMAHIFNDHLSRALGEDFKAQGYFFDGCQGYWIPNSGILFMMGVEFPIHQPSPEPAADKEKEANNLWDKYEERLSTQKAQPPSSGGFGGYGGGGFGGGMGGFGMMEGQPNEEMKRQANLNKSIEQLKVERMKETILLALARYGHRLKHAQDEKNITIIINGTGTQPQGMMMGGYGMGRFGGGFEGGMEGMMMGGGGDFVQNKSTTMIMQVSFDDLPAESGIAKDIEDKVKITTYAAGVVSNNTGSGSETPPSDQPAPAKVRR